MDAFLLVGIILLFCFGDKDNKSVRDMCTDTSFFSVLYKKTLNLYLFFNKIITFAIIFALCMQIQRTATI